jgi:hypothetical protein
MAAPIGAAIKAQANSNDHDFEITLCPSKRIARKFRAERRINAPFPITVAGITQLFHAGSVKGATHYAHTLRALLLAQP